MNNAPCKKGHHFKQDIQGMYLICQVCPIKISMRALISAPDLANYVVLWKCDIMERNNAGKEMQRKYELEDGKFVQRT